MGFGIEDLLLGLGRGLGDFTQAYSFQEQDDLRRRERANQQGLDLMYRDAGLMRDDARTAVADQRYGEQQKLAKAGLAASMLGPNQELDPLAYSFMQGTPYEARVQTTQTLPSSSIPGFGGIDMNDPGGETVHTWRPTPAQAKDIEQQAAITDLLNDPELKRYAPRIRAGLGAGELPHERAARETADDARTDARETDRDARQQKNVLEQIRLRDRLEAPSAAKADPRWTQYGNEYEAYLRAHHNAQSAEDTDPVTGRTRKKAYQTPLDFDAWLTSKGRGGGRSSTPVTMRPAPSHTVTAPGRGGGAGPKPGETRTIGGKRYTVGMVYPDGSWDPQ